MNSMQKNMLLHKEALYKQSAAELAIGTAILTIDDLLGWLVRSALESKLTKEQANELCTGMNITTDMRNHFMQSYADIMNDYVDMEAKDAITAIYAELEDRGLKQIIRFKN